MFTLRIFVFFLASTISGNLPEGAASDLMPETTGCWSTPTFGESDQAFWLDVLARFEADPCGFVEQSCSANLDPYSKVVQELVNHLASEIKTKGCRQFEETKEEATLLFSPSFDLESEQCKGARFTAFAALVEVEIDRAGFVSDSRIVRWIAGNADSTDVVVEFLRATVFVPAIEKGRFVPSTRLLVVKPQQLAP